MNNVEMLIHSHSHWFRAMRKFKRTVHSLLHPSASHILILILKRTLRPIPESVSGERPVKSNTNIFKGGALANPSGFPKIIFQTWKSRSIAPANYCAWRDTFLAENPDYATPLWDDVENRAFVRDHFAWYLPDYDSYPREIFRADAIRIFFLFMHGGYYADMDTECVRSLDDLALSGDVIFGRMGFDHDFTHSLPNAIMASRPKQGFWLFMLSMVRKRRQAYDETMMNRLGPEFFTGPMILKEAIDRYLATPREAIIAECADIITYLDPKVATEVHFGEIEILSPDEFYPLDWTNPIHRMLRANLNRTRSLLTKSECRRIFPKSTLITYWSNSWGYNDR